MGASHCTGCDATVTWTGPTDAVRAPHPYQEYYRWLEGRARLDRRTAWPVRLLANLLRAWRMR